MKLRDQFGGLGCAWNDSITAGDAPKDTDICFWVGVRTIRSLCISTNAIMIDLHPKWQSVAFTQGLKRKDTYHDHNCVLPRPKVPHLKQYPRALMC